LHTPRGVLESTATDDWQQLLIGSLLLTAAFVLLAAATNYRGSPVCSDML
jgi:hypothetical protein